jgi:hypothetical protein
MLRRKGDLKPSAEALYDDLLKRLIYPTLGDLMLEI